MKVFISHSSKDHDIAESLIGLLRLALDLSDDDIRCTSVEGYKLPAGISMHDAIRREVHGAELLIGLITPDSVQSAYVMFELGARWGASKPLIPLLAGDSTPKHLEGPLSVINASNCSTPAQIHQLLQNAASHLAIPTDSIKSPAAYQRAIDSLIFASCVHKSGQSYLSRLFRSIRCRYRKVM